MPNGVGTLGPAKNAVSPNIPDREHWAASFFYIREHAIPPALIQSEDRLGIFLDHQAFSFQSYPGWFPDISGVIFLVLRVDAHHVRNDVFPQEQMEINPSIRGLDVAWQYAKEPESLQLISVQAAVFGEGAGAIR